MLEVGRFDARRDAELARSLLAAAGIPCVLAPDEAAGTYPVDLSGAARVLVAEADARDAAVILGWHTPGDEDRQPGRPLPETNPNRKEEP